MGDNRMYIKYYEDEYNTDKMQFLIENPKKTERDFIESKIEQLNQLELEYKRKCYLSDDEVYQEIKKTERIADSISKGFDITYKKDFDQHLENEFLDFRKKYIFKEKKEDSLRLKFYKAKLENLPNIELTKEEAEPEEKMPSIIALLKELGFFELDLVKSKLKENQYAIVKKITGGTIRTIKGNILALNPESKEDRSKYTSNNHIESMKNYLDKLK